MKALLIRRHRRYIVRNVQVERQLAGASPRPHDLQLLLELAAKVDGGDVQRDRARFHTRQVQQLLRHPKHALGFLVHDRRGASALVLIQQAAIDQSLAEPDQAGEGRLELVRDIGQKIALDLPCPLDGLAHPVERRAEHPDLVLTFDAHAT